MPQWSANAEASVATRVDTAIAAGLGNHLPIGDYSGADYRSAVRFPTPAGWTGWTSISSAALSFYISDHQHVAPKSSSIYCSRMQVTAPIWTKGAGSQSCESGFTGGNNTQADDIVGTTVDRVSFSSGSTANAKKSIDVTAAMRYYWNNGNNPTVKPVFIFDNNGAGEYTELWSVQKTGGYDIVLSINYTDQEPPTAPTPTGPGNGSTSLTDQPTFSWVHNDPQGDAQANAEVRIFDAGGSTLLYTWNPTAPSNQSLVAPSTLLRGTTYQWDVRTADAAVGWGPYCAKQSVSIKANPTVSIDATRYMDFNGAPRLRVKWSANQTQTSYRVTAGAYNSGIINNGNQDHLLDSLDITDNTPVSVTVEVWTNEGLYNYASRSFTPRYGLTVHRRDLGAAPLNWGGSSEQKTVPAGCLLPVEYGSSDTATAAPTGAWQASLGSVVKRRYVFWRAWFIPSATQGPTLDRITITSDTTTGKTVDKWRNWFDVPFGPPWAVDESEYVYGTRSVRVDCPGSWVGLGSTAISVKPGRSYILTGLMKAKGNAQAYFQLIANGAGVVDENGVPIQSPVLDRDTPWFSETSQDVNRYRTPVWKATSDTVYVLLGSNGAVGTQAWFDAIKLEESTVATPWSPASIGGTVIDAGGVQIDGSKGGILRYKGTVNGPRDVVEGGANGLLFGGDAPLYSDVAGALTVPPLDGFGEYGVRAGQWVTGGGVCTFDGGGNFKWAQRFIVIAQGNGADSAANGYYDINCPTAGTVQGVGGHANATATGAGIPMAIWDALYVVLPKGQGNAAITVADFRIASYQSAMSPPPSNWVLLALRNGDDSVLYVANGLRMQTGQTLNVGGGLDVRGNIAASGDLSAAGGDLTLLDATLSRWFAGALITGGPFSGGSLHENGTRVIQPSGLLIQRGTAVVVGGSGANAYSLLVTFPVAFSAAPIVIVTQYTHNGWYAILNGVPSASNANITVANRTGATGAPGNSNVGWIAIGPA